MVAATCTQLEGIVPGMAPFVADEDLRGRHLLAVRGQVEGHLFRAIGQSEGDAVNPAERLEIVVEATLPIDRG